MNFEIATDIKTRLKAAGKTSADLSREMKINYDTLGGFINGRRKMTVDIQDRINKVLESWSA